MKFSKLFPGIILPFLMFAFFGVDCPDDEEPKICGPTRTSIDKVYRLNENSNKKKELKSPIANAECSAYFLVKYGWEDDSRFQTNDSPMENSFGGLKLTFGETSYNNTYRPVVSGKEQGAHPDGKIGDIWIIKLPVDAPSDKGNTYYYVKIEHDILEEDYNFWVDVAIEYSYDD